MAFPTITTKVTNTTIADDLKDVLETKFGSLEKFIGDETDVTCDVEFEKVAPHENGPIYRIEANLLVAGVMHRAESTMESFEQAIDEVRDQLDKELRRRNKKHATLLKRGGRRIKDMMRFGR